MRAWARVCGLALVLFAGVALAVGVAFPVGQVGWNVAVPGAAAALWFARTRYRPDDPGVWLQVVLCGMAGWFGVTLALAVWPMRYWNHTLPESPLFLAFGMLGLMQAVTGSLSIFLGALVGDAVRRRWLR
jgi:hypothetical protein